MTAAVLPMSNPRLSRATSDRAVGLDAEALRKQLKAPLELSSSVVLGERYWDLENVRWEASKDNWDGYGASRVDDVTYRVAKAFLKTLPITAPEPDIGADPDGEVSFSWRRAPDRVFSVSIGRSGRVSYAGLFGNRTAHGTEYFSDELPEPVENNLARLFPAGT